MNKNMKKIVLFIMLIIMLFTFSSCNNDKSSDQRISFFSDGLGFAYNNDDKFGYFNKNYEVVIDFIYDDASHFNDGVAWVEKDDKKFLINTNGSQISESFDYLHYDYKNKVYIGYITEESKDYLLDKKGNVLCSYDSIERFEDSKYTSVRISDNNEGYINTKGELVISGFKATDNFVYGFASIVDSNGDHWSIDEEFNKIYNFGPLDINVMGKMVIVDELIYDVYGNSYGDRDHYNGFGGRENYYILSSGDRENYYSINNDNKIENVLDQHSFEIGKYLIIFKDHTLFIYNDLLEVIDKVELEEDFDVYFHSDGSPYTDFYRNNVYIYTYSDKSEIRNCYMFNYEKAKLERMSFLDEYSVSGVYNEYLCVVKNNLYGLVYLDGKVFIEPNSKYRYVVTDDGYILNKNIVYNMNKTVVYNSFEWSGLGFNYPEY